MASDGIIDNSPEMEYGSPEFAAALAGVKPKTEKVEKEVVEEPAKDETGEEPSESPSESTPEVDDDKDVKEAEASDDPKAKALAKELKRVRALNREHEQKVTTLEKDVEELKTKASKPTDPESQIVDKMTAMKEEEFSSLHQRWSDELGDAKAAHAEAKARGDEAGTAEALARIKSAQSANALCVKAVSTRATAKAEAEAKTKAEIATLETELTGIKASYDEAFPELANKSSAIFKAGLAQYKAHQTLMSKLGPVAELVATALAVIKNPKLVGRDPSTVRKEVVNNIEEAVSNALKPGGVGTSKGGKANAIPTFKTTEDFNEYIERIKNS